MAGRLWRQGERVVSEWEVFLFSCKMEGEAIRGVSRSYEDLAFEQGGVDFLGPLDLCVRYQGSQWVLKVKNQSKKKL